VLQCLLDDDVTIKLRALELLTGMVNKHNLVDIVQKLLEHIQYADGEYRNSLVEQIITMCCKDMYAQVDGQFEWLISVFVDIAFVLHTPHGELVAEKLVDVVLRVPSVRLFAVQAMCTLLLDGRLASECGVGLGPSPFDQV
jgi:AP-3 complex subunit delta-1